MGTIYQLLLFSTSQKAYLCIFTYFNVFLRILRILGEDQCGASAVSKIMN